MTIDREDGEQTAAEVKLSERLEAACTGVLVAEATGNLDIVTDAVNKLLDAAREAAELARRFEDAPKVEITECNQIKGAKDFDYGDMVAASQKFDAGQRVRLVPDSPTPPDPGHEQDR
jgi:hypothetical protein